ncbi:MAG TPA: gliding motility-associated C-terminal domain-containing protein, partial [Draconibacterium sp.]|nr:gliding motility-associated C-terminal domain-containing protein [Draconibacterium sp.]
KTLTNIKLNDDKVNAQPVCVATTLAPGATTTCSAVYTVKQADIDAGGSVTNTVTASSNEAPAATDNLSIPVSQIPKIALIKKGKFNDVNSNGTADVGETISYNYTVENTGNINLYDVKVNEEAKYFSGTGILPVPIYDEGGSNIGGDSNIKDLFVGGIMKFKATYILTQSDIDKKTVINQAMVVSADLNKNPVNDLSDDDNREQNDPTITQLKQEPKLTIDKSTTAKGYSYLNEKISYILALENTGNVTLTNIVIVDQKTNFSKTIASLTPDSNQSFEVSYNIKETDINNGYLENTVSASYSFENIFYEVKSTVKIFAFKPPSAINDRITGIIPGKNAVIKILANDKLSDGSLPTENNSKVELIDPNTGLPTTNPNVLKVTGEGEWTYNSSTGELTFKPEIGFTTDPSPINYLLTEIFTGLKSSATVNLDYTEKPPLAENDGSTGNLPGDSATINILTNDKLSDDSPAKTAKVRIELIDPVTSNPTTTPNKLIIQGEGVWTYNPATGELNFNPEPNFTTNPKPISYLLIEISTELSDKATVTISYSSLEPGLKVNKTTNTQSYDSAGDVITYTITVKNTGNVIITDINVSDPLAGVNDIISKLDAGKEKVYDVSYIVKQTDINWGSVENTVTVEGKLAGGIVINSSAKATVNAVQNPFFVLEKTVDGIAGNLEISDNINFLIRITNTGNVTLSNIIVEDPLTGFLNNIAELNPGEWQIFNTSYVITSADLKNGKVSNTASAKGSFISGNNSQVEIVENETTVVVDVGKCELLIPQIFSPNDDGIQDFFRIQCIENYPDAKIEIYNRWGNLVYQKENYGNTTVWGNTDAWWDGYSNNNMRLGKEKLSSGTYFYILYYNDGSEPENGFIFLSR